MYRSRTVLVLIPARSGSKRIPHKNTRRLGGKPLIAYAIAAARASRYADKVVVTTDDPRIAAVAKKYHAEVPFLRPKALASDTAPVVKAVRHALSYYKKRDWHPDVVVLVQPTSPLVRGSDIDAAVRTLLSTGADSCVTVCPVSERPEWMFVLSKGKLRQRYPANIFRRSQTMPKLYRLNGAVSASRPHVILKKHLTFDPHNLAAVIMPKERSADIDDEEDWKAAERAL